MSRGNREATEQGQRLLEAGGGCQCSWNAGRAGEEVRAEQLARVCRAEGIGRLQHLFEVPGRF